MKTSDQDFNDFKESFCYWQKALGLLNWRIIFNHTKLKDLFADITIHYCQRTAVVQFTTEIDDDDKGAYDPPEHGKHEALHLLLADYDHHAHQRFTNLDELLRAEEEVVVRLQHFLHRPRKVDLDLFRRQDDASVR